ncbi:MAG TPA: hypothetical protein VJ802_11700 [Gemmatimonadaceae bacterium]|nr:hypothetical protein [Gemmatimonadaceae bacterium]
MSPASNTSGAPLPSVAILGVDALLAARPATPVQLAHACQAAGYAAVYPVTWGDELLATACTRRVAARGDDPAIFCACPHVSDALLEVGSDLARFLVPLVAPPVACARYLRALYGYNRVRITYIGACPGAHDPAIDARVTPMQFFGVLTQLDIDLHGQPEVFESVLPPDRRRHRSVPGGAPTSQMLASEGTAHTLEEIITDDWKTELAQRLLLRDRALFDVAPSLGCHCAGARPGVAPEAARPSVVALEPPRAGSDVIDPNVAVDVDRTLPVIPPRPRDVREAAPAASAAVVVSAVPPPDERPPEPSPPPAPPAPPPVLPVTTDTGAAADEEARRRKAAAPVVARAAQTVPLARTEGGQVLPRAYAARRRTPAEGGATVSPPGARAPEPLLEQPPSEEPPAEEPAVVTAVPDAVPEATAEQSAPVPLAAQEQPTASQRPTPRSVIVPIPAEELRPVPPPPAADHARAAIVTAATVAVALVAFIALRGDDGHVTTESSGIAAPAPPMVLDSLPPLTFPLPDTGAQPQWIPVDTAAAPETTPQSDSAPQTESARVAVVPSRDERAPAVRTRRRAAITRRSRTDSIALAREASRRAADSIEREAIRRELEHRRARLDTIERSLEPALSPPGR